MVPSWDLFRKSDAVAAICHAASSASAGMRGVTCRSTERSLERLRTALQRLRGDGDANGGREPQLGYGATLRDACAVATPVAARTLN